MPLLRAIGAWKTSSAEARAKKPNVCLMLVEVIGNPCIVCAYSATEGVFYNSVHDYVHE